MTHDRSSRIRDLVRMFVCHHRWGYLVCLFVCEQYSLAQTFAHSACSLWCTKCGLEVSWCTTGLARQHLTGSQDWPEGVCYGDYADVELSNGLATRPGQLHPTLTPTHYDNTL